MGGNFNIAYLYIIHADIGGIVDFEHGWWERTLLLKWEGESVALNFGQSVCYFRHSKSVLKTRETKQVGSQLYFAPKNIKIHLVVLENELIEDAMLVPEKSKNWKHIHNTYMNVWIR